MATLSTASFQQADQSGWNPASDSEDWSVAQGSPSQQDIASNEGRILTGGFAADVVVLLGSQTTEPINFLMRMKVQDGNLGPAWRWQSDGNFYRAVCETGTCYLQVFVSGGSSLLASASGDFTVYDWIQVISNADDIAVYFWADGDSPPGSPQISTTDSTYLTAGQYGISDVSYDGTLVNYLDSVTVTDNATTATRTIPTSGVFLETEERTIPTSAAFKATAARTVPTSAALLETATRDIPTSAAFLQSALRTVPTSGVLKATAHRTIPTSAVLSGVSVAPPVNSTFTVRSGESTFEVRSGESSFGVRSGESTFFVR